jgi:hypothetical protein
MGNLRPNVPYIYESPDGGKTIYAREFNNQNRTIVGYQYQLNNSYSKNISQGQKDMEEHILWNEIRQAAKTNPALHKAMQRAILIYRLSKDDPK